MSTSAGTAASSTVLTTAGTSAAVPSAKEPGTTVAAAARGKSLDRSQNRIGTAVRADYGYGPVHDMMEATPTVVTQSGGQGGLMNFASYKRDLSSLEASQGGKTPVAMSVA